MKPLRITLAQINTTVGDLDGNIERCVTALRAAEAAGSDLVVFPELALAGYPPEDLLLKPGFLTRCEEALDRFAEHVGDTCAVVGTVEGYGPIANAAAVVHRGQIRCRYHKMFLPNYGVFDENRYFTAGDGPMSIQLGPVRIGLTICEDIWVDEGPFTSLTRDHGASIVLNLSASPFHAGKIHTRRNLLSRRSMTTGATVVYVNLVGGQDELVFDGGSLVFTPDGKALCRLPLFREAVVTLDIPLPDTDTAVSRPVAPPAAVIPLSDRPDRPLLAAPPDAPDLSEPAEVYEALVIGTRDYIRKNGFSQVVIGLSGGIDSTLVAAVAVEALGCENVIGVTMPSRYTSTGTRTDAELLATNLGIRFIELPIGQAQEAFTQTLTPIFAGRAPDVTEENIQARVRGTLLMALSNKFGWLVLTTGNKSEMATGYATLYGDMAGGFAMIKDVPKTMVYHICEHINESAGSELIPRSVIGRPPTAELRPDQKDSDSLPPYDILDGILRAYIEEDAGVDAIVALGYDRETVCRVIRLVDTSEYKRRQAPPGVKITPRAFGRDRRLPITNRFRP